jgi:predicted outer membrane repeat protein
LLHHLPANLGKIPRALLFLSLLLATQTARPVRAIGATLFVAPGGATSQICNSWVNACDLQYALGTVAISGDQLWVQQGTYVPGAARSDTFTLLNGVSIYGGFAGGETALEEREPASNVTVLSGEIGAGGTTDNSFHVVAGGGTDATAVLDGFTITAGNANLWPDELGGGMYNSASSPTLSNITFSLNAAKFGGGMMNQDSYPTLTDVTFSGNSADYGGGMYSSGTGSATLTNVTFSSNSANEGGGLYNFGGSPTLTDVTFSGNSADYGGGMYSYGVPSRPTLTGVTFTANSAVLNGGGMYNLGGSWASLTNATFSGNSANIGGGMANFSGSSNTTLTNITFSLNVAEFGGGMANSASSPTLTNVTFSSNSALANGGGMYNADSSSPTLTGATFSGNSADFGGGMMNHDSNSTLTDVTFSSNSADYGGGMYSYGTSSSATLTNVTFSSNSANEGGGVYNLGGSPTLAHVTFSGNSADYGGGMYTYGVPSRPTLTDVTFSTNSAVHNGGGMYNVGGSRPDLTNATFSGNSANIGGGMANFSTSSPNLTNVTFSGNTASIGGGMYNADGSTPTLVNILIANSLNGGDCSAILALNSGSSNNLIEDSVNACGLTNGVNGNIIGQDPVLQGLSNNGGSTFTMALVAGSPAIDAGNNTSCAAAPVNGVDQRGVSRPQGAHCDIGAYEYVHLFADVPVAGKGWMEPWIDAFYYAGITTGCGTGPLVYCPENHVTRAEMAVFLLRAIHGSAYVPPAPAHDFADVPVTGKEWMEPWIEQFYAEGITTGCGGGNYCPENKVTRAEMAVFVLRALHGGAYTPPAATHTFSDVPVPGKEWMEPWIDQFAAQGITTGCGGGNYCPENNVTRAEMAVFLGRAYGLYP